MRLRIMFMAVASILGFFMAGCQKPVAATDVQGIWVAGKTSQQKWIKGTNNCQIVLRADGTFSASVPDYMMMTSDKSSGKVMSGRGKWNLEPARALDPREIRLSFSEVDGERISWGSNRLEAERGRQGVELFLYVGEEGGERFVFERAPSQSTAPAAEK